MYESKKDVGSTWRTCMRIHRTERTTRAFGPNNERSALDVSHAPSLMFRGAPDVKEVRKIVNAHMQVNRIVKCLQANSCEQGHGRHLQSSIGVSHVE